MIYLKKADYEAVLAHALSLAPEEACGLIGGVIDGAGNKRVEQVWLLENTDHSPEHFTMTPQAQLSAVKEMRAKGWQPLGNWHSHPASPSRPSEEDKCLAYDSKASYLILSLMERDAPVLNSFRIEGSRAEREALELI